MLVSAFLFQLQNLFSLNEALFLLRLLVSFLLSFFFLFWRNSWRVPRALSRHSGNPEEVGATPRFRRMGSRFFPAVGVRSRS